MEVRDIFESMEYGPAPESPDRARQWLRDRGETLQHFIGGAWCEPESGDYFDTRNPATGERLARVADGNEADVNRAVAAAADALEKWVAIGGHGRARYLYAIARRIQKHSRLFAVLESLDNGKPIRESRDIDIPLVARIIGVADTFDAITTNRPYQDASSPEKALEIIKKLTGRRFDAKIVTAFLLAWEAGNIKMDPPELVEKSSSRARLPAPPKAAAGR